MIWGPFVLALILGLIVSAGLYFAYLWPQVEPIDPPGDDVATLPVAERSSGEPPATSIEANDARIDVPGEPPPA